MAEKTVSTQSFAEKEKTAYKGKKLTVAMIGCGGISEIQLDVLKEFPDVEVVAGVDSRPERLKVMEDKYGVKSLFPDWKKMLKEVKPDAVSICTPNGQHAPASIDASNAGAHVITEKPMAMNPRECGKMIEAAKKAGKKLVCGFQFRFHPATQFITRARDEGQFGNVMFMKCQALRRRGIPNWGVFGRKELQGGGPMIDIGVHVIEMAHYVMGSPKPVAASGNTWTYMGNKPSSVVSMWPNWDHKTYNVEDLAIGQVRFENGAIMHIEASFAAHVEKDLWNFTLVGDKGGATWDPPAIFSDRAGTMINSTPAFLSKDTDFTSLFRLKLRNFVDGVLHNKPLEAPGEAGLAVQKILDGVYRSAESGREVKID
ncbi:MAG TPA: Gfo/Idh/MocA family oxidoreductase [Tepidisphaeraceae bacterium]|jgi:predicted dehydrogenase|nr:Gfo/Idh/MocA family oxidoreductase [Tepidisphaeraceae bacterium]HEV8604550.1 Gfo/Idh/MocA family oxidoreductase [Tepidisphaeraceae bacterium]